MPVLNRARINKLIAFMAAVGSAREDPVIPNILPLGRAVGGPLGPLARNIAGVNSPSRSKNRMARDKITRLVQIIGESMQKPATQGIIDRVSV